MARQWRGLLYERQYIEEHYASVYEITPTAWEWVLYKKTKKPSADLKTGTAPSMRLATVYANRAAAKLGLLKSGCGLSKKR